MTPGEWGELDASERLYLETASLHAAEERNAEIRDMK